MADIPGILKTVMSAPYALGEGLLALAFNEDGTDAVNELFCEPAQHG